jgi:hypothetical protein
VQDGTWAGVSPITSFSLSTISPPMFHTHFSIISGQYNRSLSCHITKGLHIAPPKGWDIRNKRGTNISEDQTASIFNGERWACQVPPEDLYQPPNYTLSHPKRHDLTFHTRTAAGLLKCAAEFTAKWRWGNYDIPTSFYVKHIVVSVPY